ncbi:MAG: biotin/lipoyl-binding protein, partial [Pseudomonadota bacterium]
MKLRHWLLLGLLAAGAAGIWYLTREEPLELTVGVVERGSVEQAVSNTRAGTVKACRRARLSPSTGGQISYLGVTEGDPVKVGDLLVELWNEDLKAELSLAGSERETARAKATAACLNAEVDQREADRLTRLQERRAASDEEVDKAVTQAKAARADCLAAHAAVEESSNRVAVKQATLARTRLVAPFAGVIAEVNGEVNEYVTPSPPGIATLPVIDLIDNSCFYVSAPIDE